MCTEAIAARRDAVARTAPGVLFVSTGAIAAASGTVGRAERRVLIVSTRAITAGRRAVRSADHGIFVVIAGPVTTHAVWTIGVTINVCVSVDVAVEIAIPIAVTISVGVTVSISVEIAVAVTIDHRIDDERRIGAACNQEEGEHARAANDACPDDAGASVHVQNPLLIPIVARRAVVPPLRGIVGACDG